ncbi:MAG TPA: rhomboid family intramembrane serine protease [Verrucomicrobiae bacterium]|nr:rhomboid family intramembrane serine protease [Verrucomicrobiae bacterium]
MRQIGNLPDEKQARVFGDHLVAHHIRNEIEEEGNTWAVWIHDEEQVADAKARLERFRANPAAPEFRAARSTADEVRAAEAQDLANYRRRVRSRGSLFPKFGGYGIGPLTFGLVLLCVAFAVYSKLGYDRDIVRRFVLADPENANGTFLPEVRAGQYYRLLSPAFIHFGPLHLVFNLIWLFQLGSMIEARRGTLALALLVVGTATGPFLAQYLWSGPGFVGGMSGVVYGLAGYAWMRGKHDPASGVYLDRASIQWLLLWLVVCFTGAVGNVANVAHVAGLVIGVIWGRLSAYFASGE